MNDSKVTKLRDHEAAAIDPHQMLVQLTVGELRELIAETVRETMNSKDSEILDVEGAMDF